MKNIAAERKILKEIKQLEKTHDLYYYLEYTEFYFEYKGSSKNVNYISKFISKKLHSFEFEAFLNNSDLDLKGVEVVKGENKIDVVITLGGKR